MQIEISGRKKIKESRKQMEATIAETLSPNTHLGTLGFVAWPRQYLNKSESSKYTANGDLAINKSF